MLALLATLVALGEQVASRLALPPALQEQITEAVEDVKPYIMSALEVVSATWGVLSTKGSIFLSNARERLNDSLAELEPVQIALISGAVTAACCVLLVWMGSTLSRIRAQGPIQWFFTKLRSLPIIRGMVSREMDKIREKVASSLKRDHMAITRIPARGKPAGAVLAVLHQREAHNVRISPGQSSMSGVVYIRDAAHKELLDSVYCLFSWTNPLHADIFPSVRQMEAEVISMALYLLKGGLGTSAPQACGAMTSGGTESILLAVKAARDFAKATRGVTRPELIIGASAHAAYWKAAEYFNVALKILPLGLDYCLHGPAVARAISPNTILVVASAPSFPHGLIDDVADISGAAARRGVPCHVDACLGGFFLPFAARLGCPIPPWDFSLPGVTSISLDTHKFGMAHKGTSLILYRSPELRREQYTRITDWPGGLYISPSMAGSRNGALIATAWASLVHLGEDGLTDAAEAILAAASEFQHRLVAEVPELMLVGQPQAMVVAFKSVNPKELNIYRVNDLLTARGWHLNALQAPPALHFCFTAQHSGAVAALLADVKACVALAVAERGMRGPKRGKGGAPKGGLQGPGGSQQQLLQREQLLGKVPPEEEGSAPVYGLSGATPDRGLIGEFLTVYQDTMLAP